MTSHFFSHQQGTWVTPAIQVHLGRVDVVPPENHYFVAADIPGYSTNESQSKLLNVADPMI